MRQIEPELLDKLHCTQKRLNQKKAGLPSPKAARLSI